MFLKLTRLDSSVFRIRIDRVFSYGAYPLSDHHGTTVCYSTGLQDYAEQVHDSVESIDAQIEEYGQQTIAILE